MYWKYIIHIVTILYGVSLSFVLTAQPISNSSGNLSLQELLNMNLEELMQINVVTVVETEEQLQVATSYQITENEILYKGYQTLADILADIPSVSIVEQGFSLSGEQRGVTGSFAQALLLINGRSIQDIASAKAFISKQLTVDNIKKVIITQGPLGISYGPNAYSGTINIITKQVGNNSNELEAHITTGVPNQINIGTLFNKKVGDFTFNSSLGYGSNIQDNDYTSFLADTANYASHIPAMASGIRTANQTYRNKTTTLPVSFSSSYKNFYVGANLYTHKATNHGLQYVLLNYDNQQNLANRFYGLYYAGWKQRINGKHLLNFEYRYSRERHHGKLSRFDVDTSYFNQLITHEEWLLTQKDIDENLTFSYDNSSQQHSVFSYVNTLINRVFVNVGYTFDWQDTGLSEAFYDFPLRPATALLTTTSVPIRRHSLFTDFEKLVLNGKLLSVLGARYTHHNYYGSLWNIRAGLIYHPTDRTNIKIFFNQGFKEPTALQLFEYQQSGMTDPLRASLSNNLEVNLIHRFNRSIKGSFSLFHTRFKNNIIAHNSDENGWLQWMNSPNISKQIGLEGRFFYNIRRCTATLHYSYVHNYNESQIYKYRIATNLSYRFLPNLRTNMQVNYFPVTRFNYNHLNTSSTHLFSANIQTNLTVSSKVISNDKLKVHVLGAIKNIFNTSFIQPNVENTGLERLLQPGRQFIGKIIFKYN